MKCNIKKFDGFKVKFVNNKKFVGSWSDKKKEIYINKKYLDKKSVSCNDIKAILNHEETERKNYFKGKSMILSHCLANKKEKKYLNKKGMKFAPHQKEIIQTYRKYLSDDAPYYDIRC